MLAGWSASPLAPRAGSPGREPDVRPASYIEGVAQDDGYPIHYRAVQRGTPVYASDGQQVGKVDEVVDNYRERILDGFVIETRDGRLRFVDAPEVARTAERAVRLTIDSAAAAQLPAPEKAAPSFSPRRSGRLGKLLGGGWRRR
jgi:sporulation protein YlmC with PRC-barrel domain